MKTERMDCPASQVHRTDSQVRSPDYQPAPDILPLTAQPQRPRTVHTIPVYWPAILTVGCYLAADFLMAGRELPSDTRLIDLAGGLCLVVSAQPLRHRRRRSSTVIRAPLRLPG
jgi:hypothetical protein